MQDLPLNPEAVKIASRIAGLAYNPARDFIAESGGRNDPMFAFVLA